MADQVINLPPSGASSVTVTGGLTAATTVTIYNVTTAGANIETSQLLTSNTKQFNIRVRGRAQLQLAFVTAQSGTLFETIPPGCTASWTDLDFTGTIYFQVNKATQIVEIVEWS